MNLGSVIGMPVSGLLSDTKLGWTMIFYAMAGLMVVTSVVWQLLTASTPGEHRWMTPEEKEYIERGLNISNEVCDKSETAIFKGSRLSLSVLKTESVSN